MENSSIKSRFTISAISNIIRGGITFFTTLIIARVLGPEDYGNYAYLMGSFIAMRSLLDMGTASAFFTFISKRPRPLAFYTSYAIWHLIQFFLPFIIIAFILPQAWLEAIWVGQERNLVLLAFSALFFQQLLWPTINYIGESKRLTSRVQTLNISISTANLGIVCGAWFLGKLTVQVLFWILLLQYLIALVSALEILNVFDVKRESLDIRAMLGEYFDYCLPLVIFSVLGFAYEFADRWLLQSFGGSEEQAFYMVGYRFAAIGMLATTSILNIFWKEISEALENNNSGRLQQLYRRISRFLLTASSIICGFAVPWSETIIIMTLGASYASAAPVVAVMFIFSIYSGMSQVNGTFILSSSKTKAYLIQGIIFMVISIPISYFVQAPHDALIPGLQLGSLGMAWKIMILNVIQMNFVSWWIAKKYGWKFDWLHQVVCLTGTMTLGFISYELIIRINSILDLNIYLQIGIALTIYMVMIVAYIWQLPWLTGFSRAELANLISTANKQLLVK